MYIRYIDVLFHTFYYQLGNENRSLQGRSQGGSWGARDPPFVGLLLNKQPTIFRWRKRHDNILAVKAIVEKPTFLKFVFFVKYFRQRLLSLVNMSLHAAIIRLSPLIHEGEQRYKPKLVGDPRTVSLLNITKSLCGPPFEKSWLRPCVITRTSLYRGSLYRGLTLLKQA